MGYKGYQELKIALAQNVVSYSQVKQIQQDIELSDTVSDICKKVFNATIQSLRDTESILNSDDIKTAVEYITGANSISFYGIGGSGVVATDAFYRFSKLGISCHLFTDSHSQINRSLMTKADDVIIAISHSGKTKDVLMAVNIAKENQAKVIAVTQFGNSPITKISDVILCTSSNETVFRHEAMASRIAEQAILDSLFVAASMTRYKDVVKNYEKSWKLSESMRINNIKDLKTQL